MLTDQRCRSNAKTISDGEGQVHDVHTDLMGRVLLGTQIGNHLDEEEEADAKEYLLQRRAGENLHDRGKRFKFMT